MVGVPWAEEDCDEGHVEWIADYIGQCAYSPRQHAAVILGLVSIAWWCVAQFVGWVRAMMLM